MGAPSGYTCESRKLPFFARLRSSAWEPSSAVDRVVADAIGQPVMHQAAKRFRPQHALGIPLLVVVDADSQRGGQQKNRLEVGRAEGAGGAALRLRRPGRDCWSPAGSAHPGKARRSRGRRTPACWSNWLPMTLKAAAACCVGGQVAPSGDIAQGRVLDDSPARCVAVLHMQPFVVGRQKLAGRRVGCECGRTGLRPERHVAVQEREITGPSTTPGGVTQRPDAAAAILRIDVKRRAAKQGLRRHAAR